MEFLRVFFLKTLAPDDFTGRTTSRPTSGVSKTIIVLVRWARIWSRLNFNHRLPKMTVWASLKTPPRWMATQAANEGSDDEAATNEGSGDEGPAI